MSKNTIHIGKIEDLEKLKEIKDGEGAVIYLENSICFTDANDFESLDLPNSNIIINGLGNTIDGLISSNGLFKEIKNLKVKSLNISFSEINSEEGFATGLLAGIVHETAVISQCKFNGVVKGQKNTGGVIGLCRTFVIDSSVSELDVTGKDFTGGLVGRAINYVHNNTTVEGSVNVSTKEELETAGVFCGFAENREIRNNPRYEKRMIKSVTL